MLNTNINHTNYLSQEIAAIFQAAKHKDLNTLEYLVRNRDLKLNYLDEKGNTFIHVLLHTNRYLRANNYVDNHYAYALPLHFNTDPLNIVEGWINAGKIDVIYHNQGFDIIKYCLSSFTPFHFQDNKPLEYKRISNSDDKYFALAEKILLSMKSSNRFTENCIKVIDFCLEIIGSQSRDFNLYTQNPIKKSCLDFVKKIIYLNITNQEFTARCSNYLLHESVRKVNNIDFTKLLLSVHDTNLQQNNYEGKTAFQIASEYNNGKAIELITAFNPSTN